MLLGILLSLSVSFSSSGNWRKQATEYDMGITVLNALTAGVMLDLLRSAYYYTKNKLMDLSFSSSTNYSKYFFK